MERRKQLDRTNLLVLSLLNSGDMYGYQMIIELERRSSGVFKMKEGTLYPILHGLENTGALRSYQKEAETGRMRKYYHITEAGKRQLDRETEAWTEYAEAIEGVLGTARGLA